MSNYAKAKSIPKATDLEELVLAAMLIDSNSIDEAITLLKDPDMFYKTQHKYVYGAILSLYHKKEAIDLATISEELKRRGELDKAGGDYALIELTQKVSSSAHIEHHCRILMQYWIKRKLIHNSNLVISEAFDDKSDPLDLLNDAANMLDEIQEIIQSGRKNKTYSQALKDVVQRVELISNQEDHELTGVTSGINWINKFTGGWQPSDLVIVAARPGMGKTAFIMNNLVECGKLGIPAGVISLEMSIEQLTARTIAINSNFHLSQLIRDGFEKDSYFTTLQSTTHKMDKFPIYIDDRGSLDIQDIISTARIWKRKYGLKILFVDYIQLATDRTKGNNREQEIASISRNLKKIAKELQIPVIALSQLSRQVETRTDKRPKLSDLRESGAIEQDADAVTFLYRESYYNEEAERPFPESSHIHKTEFIFAKNRHGSLGFEDLYMDMNKVKFLDPETFNPYQVPAMDPETDEPF